ncbi:MAG: (Fe-S)-binding protein [Candidatus Helarchaeota archaeon]
MVWKELHYFLGCTSFLHKDTALNMVKILDSVGIKYKFLKNEPCCAGILFLQGNIEEGIEKAKKNYQYFKENNVSKFLVNCPECLLALKKEYPKYIEKWDIQVKHSTELIAEIIREGLLNLNPVNLKVTYHDSCHLGRFNEIYDAPRFIIKNIPGLKFKEMDLNKKDAQCCGGTIRDAFIELRNDLTLDLIKSSRRKGKIILTGCPTCKYNFNTVAELFEQKSRSLDIIDLVAYSAGLITKLPLKEESD